MKTPVAWLRRYVDLPAGATPAALAERFAALGFPVGAIDEAPALSGIVVGRLTAVEKHPNADRLSVCTVDVGGLVPLTIATNATNVEAGQSVPVAVVGSHVIGRNEDGSPFDLPITPRTMRGVESAGMLCSAGELGLPGEWFEEGILLLEEGLTPGADAIAVLGLGDGVLDVEVTSNRPDALAVVGLARELAASFGLPLRMPDSDPEPPVPSDPAFSVTLESADCTRFVAQVFTGARNGTAPGWMRALLALAGQRPLGLLVDISNFVMLELGQPLHFYDASEIAEKRLVVRDAREGERLKTLDDEERTLNGRALVVADDVAALGLAGIKGGASSRLSPGTTDLVLEAATFSGPRIRRTAIALGLRTEASARHEKGLPPGLADVAAARAASLVRRLAGAAARPPFVTGAPLAPAPAVRIGPPDVTRSIGTRVSVDEMRVALRGLGFATEPSSDGEALDVRPPYWRGDVTIVEDVVEEVARMVGFDRIEAVMPPVFAHGVESAAYERERDVARTLAALGYREVMTYALGPASIRERFVRAQIAPPFASVEIRNPLSEDQRFLRFSLLPGLLALAARHAGTEPARIFEIGHIFRAGDGGTIEEIAAVAWLFARPQAAASEPAWHDAGFGTLKGETLAFARALAGRDGTVTRAPGLGLHPGKSAALTLPGEARPFALFGAVDPRLLASFDIDAAVYAGFAWLDRLAPRAVPAYRAPSRYPAVERDFAVVVDPEVDAATIESTLRDGGDLVRAVRVFDEYRGPQAGEGRKSLAVRVTLQRGDATLTEAEVERATASLLTLLAERHQAAVRA